MTYANAAHSWSADVGWLLKRFSWTTYRGFDVHCLSCHFHAFIVISVIACSLITSQNTAFTESTWLESCSASRYRNFSLSSASLALSARDARLQAAKRLESYWECCNNPQGLYMRLHVAVSQRKTALFNDKYFY